jgi:hypothetical protein
MPKILAKGKLGPRFILAVLFMAAELASSQLSYARSRETRVTPERQYNRAPYEYGPAYGPYRSSVLPDSSQTGPMSPDINGG